MIKHHQKSPVNMDELQSLISLLDPPLPAATVTDKIGAVLETGGKVIQLGELLSTAISDMERGVSIHSANLGFIRHLVSHILSVISDDIESVRTIFATENRDDYLNYRIAVLSEQIDRRYILLKDFAAALHKYISRVEERLELLPEADKQDRQQ